MCKGLVCSRNSKKASVTGVESRRVVVHEVRQRGPNYIGPCKDFGFYSE